LVEMLWSSVTDPLMAVGEDVWDVKPEADWENFIGDWEPKEISSYPLITSPNNPDVLPEKVQSRDAFIQLVSKLWLSIAWWTDYKRLRVQEQYGALDLNDKSSLLEILPNFNNKKPDHKEKVLKFWEDGIVIMKWTNITNIIARSSILTMIAALNSSQWLNLSVASWAQKIYKELHYRFKKSIYSELKRAINNSKKVKFKTNGSRVIEFSGGWRLVINDSVLDILSDHGDYLINLGQNR
jgi:hypothetical protein